MSGTPQSTATNSDPQTLDEAFAVINEELLQMFLKKHKDYGKGNILSVREMGIVFRMAEKVERLKNLLMKGEAPANESIDETLIDIGVYANIALLLRRGQFEKLEVNQDILDAI